MMQKTHSIALVAFLFCPALASAAPKQGDVTAKVAVAGPVELELATTDADITIKSGAAKSVVVTVADSKAKSVGLAKRGKKGIEVTFDGDDRLREGRVTVSLPAGSDLDLVTVSGDVVLSGTGGNVSLKTVSGDVKLDKAADVELTTVSGNLVLRAVSGAVRARSVSGDASIETTGRPDSKFEFETTSGELDWTGRCGKGCSLEAKTLSGEIDLALDKASSFDLDFTSFSGELDDSLGVTVKSSKSNRHGGGTVRARYRDGAGSIEVESFSGELELKKK